MEIRNGVVYINDEPLEEDYVYYIGGVADPAGDFPKTLVPKAVILFWAIVGITQRIPDIGRIHILSQRIRFLEKRYSAIIRLSISCIKRQKVCVQRNRTGPETHSLYKGCGLFYLIRSHAEKLFESYAPANPLK